MEIRHASTQDLPGVAAVFHAAFPESVAHIWGAGQSASTDLTASLFAVCLSSEPDAFWVAEEGGRVMGYMFAPIQLSRIWRVALREGWIWRWGAGWASGRFGLGWRPVRLALFNKLSFLRHAIWDRHKVDARILSVAVDPRFQGRGIARRLCSLALARLDRLGATSVRLEVRPANRPAVKLYTDFGFRKVGAMADAQGQWWVMLRQRPAD